MSKEELITKLIKEDKITLEEAVILLKSEVTYISLPQPRDYPFPAYPTPTWYQTIC